MENNYDRNLRWSLLRAIEWGTWPAFLSVPVVPVLLTYFEWWKVLGVVVILTVIWSVVRYKYVNIFLARLGVYFTLTKWITCPISAIYLILQKNYIVAALALFWPILSGFMTIFVGGTKAGKIQTMFMSKLGYVSSKNLD